MLKVVHNELLKGFRQKLETYYQLWSTLNTKEKIVYRSYIDNIIRYNFNNSDEIGYVKLKNKLITNQITEEIKLSKYSTGAIFKLIINHFPTIKLEAETELQYIGFKIL